MDEDTGGIFLAHTLSVSDVMVAFEATCRSHNTVRMIKTAELLRSAGSEAFLETPFRWHVTIKAPNRSERVGLVPDAMFALESENGSQPPHRSYYFLEADRGTMPVKRESLTLSSIYRKALAYIESRKCGVVNERFNIPAFRVLFVTKSVERMNNMRAACKEANGDRDSAMFLFTTQADVSKPENILLLTWYATNGENKRLV